MITADQEGFVTGVNAEFTATFGWTAAAIEGQPLTTIVPPELHDAHNLGFSRLLTTGSPRIMGQRLRLPVVTASGQTRHAEVCIRGGQEHDAWRFSATLVPLD